MTLSQPLTILGLPPKTTPAPATRYSPLSAALANCPLDALYLHIPFCATKCHYCDFYSFAGHLDKAPEFLTALATELRLHAAFFGTLRPRTIFIGGGTPTLLPPEQLRQLLALLAARVDFSGVEEFTVEANPNTFDAAKAQILAAGGVNRISFGAQSFHASELRTLQRDHDPESVPEAFAIARRAGIDNLNVDLIFGIPGQTLDSWETSLARALALRPNHMSCYSLTYEPNTAMTARLQRGEFAKIDEDAELAMFEHVFERLRAAGFVRYETSNFARVAQGTSSEGPPDAMQAAHICRHNLCYWKAGNWLGLGPSAGSHVAAPTHAEEAPPKDTVAFQWKNIGRMAHYVEALRPGDARIPVTQWEGLSRGKWAAGVAVFWLRLAEGLDFAAFEKRTGVHPEAPLRMALAQFAGLGLVDITATHARISDRGVPVSNHMLARVLAEFESAKP